MSKGTGIESPLDLRPIQCLQWREVGPHRGGRTVAVSGVPLNPRTFYFGSVGGGVWKSDNAGGSWRNVSDGYFGTSSVGALAVAEADPNIVYVGMGEHTMRGNISRGDGMYRSTDGGRTWKHIGLSDSRHISRVRVHPRDPDVVYVAVLGHAFGPNEDRGVFRSTNGGASWKKVLFRNAHTGAIDLCLDPRNPRILYAALWDVQRSPWSLASGGPGSGLFRSVDGGETWDELTDKPGFPAGVNGKIGVSASGGKAGRIWAVVEAEAGGVYRSDDNGETWKRLNSTSQLRTRPWYFSRIFADPIQSDVVYVANVYFWRSKDGGHTFEWIPTPHLDHHDCWIDPTDSQRMIIGHDGGACVSLDGGGFWSSIYNQPTGEFYHVAVDNRVPYRLYGTQQDNNTISLPSRSDGVAITERDWYEFGGGESGYIAVRRDDPNVIYAGSVAGYLSRYDHRSRQRQAISVWPLISYGWPAKSHKYRFNWTFPILLSPHDSTILYVGGNCLFRSTTEGSEWEAISPDLTRNDRSKMEPSGGPISKDNVGTETYGTIFALAESPLEKGVLWVGSDDGLVHLSKDGGGTWKDITPGELPEWTLISYIEASPHHPGTAYLAATRYKLDGFSSYVFRTDDFGQTWRKIPPDLREADYARVVREDPVRPGLLYLGTESGIFASFNRGESWVPLNLNLPVVPIHDIVFAGDDLVVATHGRGLWILDDLNPLRELKAGSEDRALLFRPKDTYRFRTADRLMIPEEAKDSQQVQVLVTPSGMTLFLDKPADKNSSARFLDAGQNPPTGAVIRFFLRDAPASPVQLTIYDRKNQAVRRFSSSTTVAESEFPRVESLLVQPGQNQFVWDMMTPAATKITDAVMWRGEIRGPLVPPGDYEVELRILDYSIRRPLRILKDPRVESDEAELEAQYSLLIEINRKLSDVHNAILTIRSVRNQIDAVQARLRATGIGDRGLSIGQELLDKLREIEEELIQVRARTPQDLMNFPPKINNQLAYLAMMLSTADAKPTMQARQVFHELAERADHLLSKMGNILAEDLPKLNETIDSLGVKHVALGHH